MNQIWQDVAVVCAVLVASFYVVRHVWRRLFSGRPRCCDTCRSCPGTPTARQPITLDPPHSTRDD